MLEGSWIPQLSSKVDGTYDALDDKTYSLADIYQQYLTLRLRYPNVRLLNSSDWDAYSLDGYWVVIAGVPFIYPNQANRWCSSVASTVPVLRQTAHTRRCPCRNHQTPPVRSRARIRNSHTKQAPAQRREDCPGWPCDLAATR